MVSNTIIKLVQAQAERGKHVIDLISICIPETVILSSWEELILHGVERETSLAYCQFQPL